MYTTAHVMFDILKLIWHIITIIIIDININAKIFRDWRLPQNLWGLNIKILRSWKKVQQILGFENDHKSRNPKIAVFQRGM